MNLGGFFQAGEKAIEEKVGPKVRAEEATCCGNCLENIMRPPHVCRMLDTTGKAIPTMNSMILNPYVKLKGCPYGEAGRK
jgi:hypothetical protein